MTTIGVLWYFIPHGTGSDSPDVDVIGKGAGVMRRGRLARLARRGAAELLRVVVALATLVVLPSVFIGWAAWLAAWLLGLGALSAWARAAGGGAGLLLGLWFLTFLVRSHLDRDGDEDDGEEDERPILAAQRKETEQAAWVN